MDYSWQLAYPASRIGYRMLTTHAWCWLQVEQGEHVTYAFNPNARAWDEELSEEAPPTYIPPSLDE